MRIGLNMIMKNESRVLPRLLNSILPIIDTYCVVDTGSTDDSKKIVKDFFDSKNIKGEIFDHPFVNFSDARNFALSKIKGKCDFGFLIDADEEIIIKPGFDIGKFKTELTKHDIGIGIVDSGLRYVRRNFFRTSKRFRWEGVVHEYLVCDDPHSTFNVEGIETIVHPDGNSWTSQSQREKYLGHAKMLHEEVDRSNDPRSIFYLAQSYKDAGEHDKSIDWYRRRVLRTDGFFEERYYSQHSIGKLYRDIGEYPQAILEFMRCFELDDKRAEHIVPLIEELQKQQCYQVAYIFSKYAVEKYHGKNPYPDRSLFLNNDAYSQKLMTLHLQNCKKIGKNEDIKILRNNIPIDDFFSMVVSAWTGHREFAKWIAEELNVSVIVDLGVDYGYSTYALAMAGKGKVYGIDNFKGDPFTGIRNTMEFVTDSLEYLKEKGIKNIEIINGDFNAVAERWKKKIDILHIDEVPTEIKNDYDRWSSFVKDDGVILLHNTQAFPEVKEFFAKLTLPKYEFTHSGGLGVVSRNQNIIDKIRNKYSPSLPYRIIPKEKITIAYISHDKNVFDKYLRPSLKNLIGNFEVINVSSKDAMPATNYNRMMDMAKTKYVLFLHEDVTFSPDFLNRIHMAINTHPNFGAMGVVGNYRNNIEWGTHGKIMDVTTCDGCCVLLNKHHGIRFDNQTFSDYHLYVDDYFLQCKNKGLKNYTIPINAYEASLAPPDSESESYFKHHSKTVSERGYCWGRYNEYLEKMDNKWKTIDVGISTFHAEVDVCIVSYAKTDELKKITERGIESLLASEKNIKFNIFVMESNNEISYDNFENTKTFHPTIEFNYNAYLNLLRKQGKAEFVCLCNNDLIFEKSWASEIIFWMRADSSIMSASPFCPQTQNKINFPNNIYIGNRVRIELAGWCIFQQRKIYETIEKLDEGVSFWFSDNLYSDQLMYQNISHALVTKSIVNHHENNLGATGITTLDKSRMDEFTIGQYQKYLKAKDNILNSKKIAV